MYDLSRYNAGMARLLIIGAVLVFPLIGQSQGANARHMQALAETEEDTIFQRISGNEGTGAILDAGVTYQGELWSNVVGGRKPGWAYMDNIDFVVNYRPEFLPWKGARIRGYLMGNQGASISTLAGDAQGISNIEAVNSWRLFEGLYFQRFKGINTSLAVGVYDVNAEFDLIPAGDFFINSSHGIGPGFGMSGITGPSTFPITSLAFRARTKIFPGAVLKAAVVDGVPSRPGYPRGTRIRLDKEEGALVAAEVSIYGAQAHRTPRQGDFLLSRAIETEPGFKVALGGWLYTEKRTGFQQHPQIAPAAYRERGVYALANMPLHERKSAEPRMSGFVRIGINHGKVNRFSHYLGSGLLFRGLIPGRDQDKTGIAVATAVNSIPYRNQQELSGISTAPSEINIELSHEFEVYEWLQLQMDAQYIRHPNALRDRDDALVVGSRLTLNPGAP